MNFLKARVGTINNMLPVFLMLFMLIIYVCIGMWIFLSAISNQTERCHNTCLSDIILLGTSILSNCHKMHREDFMIGSMHNFSIEIDIICVNSAVQYFHLCVSNGKKEIA